jgi:hypothetical protein
MSTVSQNLIDLLQYLLPGFLAAWVYYALTAHEKPNEFGQVVQALILTLVVQCALFLERWICFGVGAYLSFGAWGPDADFANSVWLAVSVGLALAYAANNDLFHQIARRFKISQASSYPSEWYEAFRTRVSYTVVHLKDGRRLYGWPKVWPSHPNKGHLLIVQPSWLVDKEEHPVTGVESMLLSVDDIMWIEFMEKTWEHTNEQDTGKSAALDMSRSTRGQGHQRKPASAVSETATAAPTSATSKKQGLDSQIHSGHDE